MSLRSRTIELTATLGMVLLTFGAILFIYAELVSRAVAQGLPQQERSLAEAVAQLEGHPAPCEGPTGESADPTHQETLDRLRRALAATLDVSYPFQGGVLFASFKAGLPLTGGLYSIYHGSTAAQHHLVQLVDALERCHGVSDAGRTDAREEDQSSQAPTSGQRGRLRELAREMAAARATFQEERPKLTALAWSLGILQFIGCGCLLLLPVELRAWRKRRAQHWDQVAEIGGGVR